MHDLGSRIDGFSGSSGVLRLILGSYNGAEVPKGQQKAGDGRLGAWHHTTEAQKELAKLLFPLCYSYNYTLNPKP